jgi:hypothetical protein
MKRVRARLALLGPAIAGLFALTIALPPPALLYHEHAGGTRAHVHADDADTIAELLEHHHHDQGHGHDHGVDADHPHSHHSRHHPRGAAIDHAAAATAHGGLVHNDGSATGHWHQRLRFQRAVAVAAPALSAGLFAGATAQAPPTRPGHPWAPPAQARAPPDSLSLS